ncbi:SCO family protein [Parasulfitobacter algicola]|uniref:SCO family protein n=1 Tax=Parasulfitobacter algicola TaxID=2614809 RepID=A0ABX2IS44_9RHOB|nr:SCO family protein [Sulfitobacter algicola]NSX53602.1 SCO family protein [Sulfitobacter algicola]
MSKGFAVAATVSVAALVAGAVLLTTVMAPADRFADCRTSVVAGGPSSIGGPFSLINQDSQPVTDQDIITEPTLIYFGYTFCPDVCPLDLARNVEAIDILETEQGKIVKPVFISIDPERDTPEVVGDFAANHHPRMVGLTGSEEQVAAASKTFKTFYQRQDDDPDYYLINHSTLSYLVFPEDGFVQHFDRTLRPDQMAQQLSCFLDAA